MPPLFPSVETPKKDLEDMNVDSEADPSPLTTTSPKLHPADSAPLHFPPRPLAPSPKNDLYDIPPSPFYDPAYNPFDKTPRAAKTPNRVEHYKRERASSSPETPLRDKKSTVLAAFPPFRKQLHAAAPIFALTAVEKTTSADDSTAVQPKTGNLDKVGEGKPQEKGRTSEDTNTDAESKTPLEGGGR
jgi:hypothetical protein